MPNIQRSPVSGQQCSSESEIQTVPRDDGAREHIGKRQKRRKITSPPGTMEKDASAPPEVSLIAEFRQEFANCIGEMREFRREMAELRESFAAFTTRLDNVEQRLDALERRQTGNESGGTAELERTIAQLRLELNDRDQEALLADLEIGHLPEVKGENVLHSVTVLAAQLGVTLEQRDVVFAERTGAPPAESGRARRVVVRLARRHLRDELLRAARVRRAVPTEGGGRVFLNERLTRPNRQLFHRAREDCRRLQWRYCWTRRGRIFARQNDGTQVFQLRSPDDLVKVFGAMSS